MTEPEVDLEPIIKFLRAGGHPFFAAGLFDVPEKTIRLWMRSENMKVKRIFGSVETDLRNSQILILRQTDKSMTEIATQVGCTPSNVSLILTKHGDTRRKVISKEQRDKWEHQKEVRIIECHLLFLEMRGDDKLYSEIKEAIGLDAYLKVMKIIKLGNPSLYAKIRKEQTTQTTERVWADKEKIIKKRHKRGHYKKVGKRIKELWTDPDYRGTRGTDNGKASD